MVAARAALLDALEALAAQPDAVVLVGAQAIYMYTGDAPVAVAAFTKDADFALDTNHLSDDPLIEEAMTGGKFVKNIEQPQPGAWVSPSGIPVDLMVAEAQAGSGGRRGIRVPPHDSGAARRTVGLEAAVVDNRLMDIAALDPETDGRVFTIKVASPAALLVAKLHKIGERLNQGREVSNKDAHDVYRLLQALPTADFVSGFETILGEPLSASVGQSALAFLAEHFAAGPDAEGARRSGRAEAEVGDPEITAASVAALAGDLLRALVDAKLTA